MSPVGVKWVSAVLALSSHHRQNAPEVKLSKRSREIIRWIAIPVVIPVGASLSLFLTILWAKNGLHRQYLEPVGAFLATFFVFFFGWLVSSPMENSGKPDRFRGRRLDRIRVPSLV